MGRKYILTAAVGISAGVEALTSAFSRLQPYTLEVCLLILAVLALVNMRGVKDTGKAFIIPTFLFVGTLLTLIAVGVIKTVLAHGHPTSLAVLPALGAQTMSYLSIWLLMKAFSSGCAAMTGVEAVSNGVMAFGEPRTKNAQRTLTVVIGILMVLLFGITWLAKKYQIMPMDPNSPQLQSLLSLLVSAVFGRGWFYFVTMGSVLLALCLSANTAFADFPRLTRAIAQHDFLPHVFILRGRRLLFSHGIYALTGFTAIILILFKGITDRLIPLYAIGAFLAFTLSQAGMVMHWRKEPAHPGRGWHMFVNGFGAVATGLTTIVVVIAKFMAGAWVTVLLVPTLIWIMHSVRKHYKQVNTEMCDQSALSLDNMEQPIVVIPMARWDKITEKALRFGLLLSKDVKVVHVHSDDAEADAGLESVWENLIRKPIVEKGMTMPELVTIPSTYRFIVSPLMDYIIKLEAQFPERKVAVVLPEMVVRHWWENALHNQRVAVLKLLLLLKGNQRIVVVSIPWYL